jgi:hypothetical protein
MRMRPFEILEIKKTTVNVVKSGLIPHRDQDQVIAAEMCAGEFIAHVDHMPGRARHLSETHVICRILRLFAA